MTAPRQSLAEKLNALQAKTELLNARGDDANDKIRSAEEALRKIGVGLEVWNGYLGYGKHQNHWRILLRFEPSGHAVPIPLMEAKREDRIKYVTQIPILLEAIDQALTSQLEAL